MSEEPAGVESWIDLLRELHATKRALSQRIWDTEQTIANKIAKYKVGDIVSYGREDRRRRAQVMAVLYWGDDRCRYIVRWINKDKTLGKETHEARDGWDDIKLESCDAV